MPDIVTFMISATATAVVVGFLVGIVGAFASSGRD